MTLVFVMKAGIAAINVRFYSSLSIQKIIKDLGIIMNQMYELLSRQRPCQSRCQFMMRISRGGVFVLKIKPLALVLLPMVGAGN